MKITRLRVLALALVAAAVTFVGMGNSSAQGVDIRVGGGGPPPPRHERRWDPPYRGAVWIGGHQEWRGGGWVWVGGYYDYPPYPGAYWEPGHYRHGYWRPGHWRR